MNKLKSKLANEDFTIEKETRLALKLADLEVSLKENQKLKKQKKSENEDLDHEIKIKKDQSLKKLDHHPIKGPNQKKSQNDQNQEIIKVAVKRTGQDLLDTNMLLGHQSPLEEKCMKRNLRSTKQINSIEE